MGKSVQRGASSSSERLSVLRAKGLSLGHCCCCLWVIQQQWVMLATDLENPKACCGDKTKTEPYFVPS